MRFTPVSDEPGRAVIDVKTPSGSQFLFTQVSTGTVKVQTSGEQRILLDHTPFYVQGTVTARQDRLGPGVPVVEAHLPQISYRFTGHDQSAPPQHVQDGVRAEILTAAAGLFTSRYGEPIGLLESGDDAFRSAAWSHFQDAAVRAEAAAARQSHQLAVLEDQLERARREYAQVDATARDLLADRRRAEELLGSISDAAKCLMVHGEVIAFGKHRWAVSSDGRRFERVGGGDVLRPDYVLVRDMRAKFGELSGCGRVEEHSVSEFAAGLARRGRVLLDL